MIRLVTSNIVTDGSGDFTETVIAEGKLLQFRYLDGDLDTGADITLVGATTGLSFINLTNAGTSDITFAPRQPIHDEVGDASLYAAAGEPVEDFIYAGGEQLTLTVAQGGASKSGTLYMWFGD